MLWAMQRDALNYVEIRPWVLDPIVGWRAQDARLVTTSVEAAFNLLPRGAKFERMDHDRGCIWWSTPGPAA